MKCRPPAREEVCREPAAAAARSSPHPARSNSPGPIAQQHPSMTSPAYTWTPVIVTHALLAATAVVLGAGLLRGGLGFGPCATPDGQGGAAGCPAAQEPPAGTQHPGRRPDRSAERRPAAPAPLVRRHCAAAEQHAEPPFNHRQDRTCSRKRGPGWIGMSAARSLNPTPPRSPAADQPAASPARPAAAAGSAARRTGAATRPRAHAPRRAGRASRGRSRGSIAAARPPR